MALYSKLETAEETTENKFNPIEVSKDMVASSLVTIPEEAQGEAVKRSYLWFQVNWRAVMKNGAFPLALNRALV